MSNAEREGGGREGGKLFGDGSNGSDDSDDDDNEAGDAKHRPNFLHF